MSEWLPSSRLFCFPRFFAIVVSLAAVWWLCLDRVIKPESPTWDPGEFPSKLSSEKRLPHLRSFLSARKRWPASILQTLCILWPVFVEFPQNCAAHWFTIFIAKHVTNRLPVSVCSSLDATSSYCAFFGSGRFCRVHRVFSPRCTL